MRFLRVLMVFTLIFSLIVNIVLWRKYRNSRAIFSVNGQGFSEKDMNDFLKAEGGLDVKAKITQRYLIEQEAKRLNVMPTDKEVDDVWNEMLEKEWKVARQFTTQPWKIKEGKRTLKTNMARSRILVKDVPVSPEELQTAYSANAPMFDTPNKAKTEVAAIIDSTVTEPVKEAMSHNPPMSPTNIVRQYTQRKLIFLGVDSKFSFFQPFGDTKMNAEVFKMKPGEVRVVPPTQDLAQAGAKAMIIRMEEIVPGHKADMNDPKVKEKIFNSVAGQRAKPWMEVLRGLWDKCKFESEDPTDKKYVEYSFFPDRIGEQ